jgi:hypothetical protein
LGKRSLASIGTAGRPAAVIGTEGLSAPMTCVAVLVASEGAIGLVLLRRRI